eukprot:GHVU01189634.1.p1 GENE.GHVU01189634.1~~GHVU01189634.1.p1  ORF type:complete len:224 (+),score=36.27 GHVU01189634.1:57-674(+)
MMPQPKPVEMARRLVAVPCVSGETNVREGVTFATRGGEEEGKATYEQHFPSVTTFLRRKTSNSSQPVGEDGRGGGDSAGDKMDIEEEDDQWAGHVEGQWESTPPVLSDEAASCSSSRSRGNPPRESREQLRKQEEADIKEALRRSLEKEHRTTHTLDGRHPDASSSSTSSASGTGRGDSSGATRGNSCRAGKGGDSLPHRARIPV